jgi:hypothetical protein
MTIHCSTQDRRGLVVHVLGGLGREPQGHQGPPQHPQARHQCALRPQGEEGAVALAHSQGARGPRGGAGSDAGQARGGSGALLLRLQEPRRADALSCCCCLQKCAACRKDAPTDAAECSACHSKTHFKCVDPPLQALPPIPWFCEKCLTGQADRILDFLQQTRRVLVERIAEQQKSAQGQGQPEALEDEDAAMASVEDGPADDKAGEADDAAESKHAADASPASSEEEKEEEAVSQGVSASGDTSREPKEPTTADSEQKSEKVPSDEPAATAEVSTKQNEAGCVSTDAKETEQKVVDSVSSEVTTSAAKGVEEIGKADKEEDATEVRDGDAQLVAAEPTKTPSVRWPHLFDGLPVDPNLAECCINRLKRSSSR